MKKRMFLKGQNKKGVDKKDTDKKSGVNTKPDILSQEYVAAVCAASYLGKKGYTIPKSVLSKEDLDFLYADLYVKPKQQGPQYGPASADDSVAFPVYRENENKIYIPRFYGIARYGRPTRSEVVKGVDTDVPFVKDLRDYQDKIIGIYMNHISKSDSETPLSVSSASVNTGSAGAILEVPCGRGKCLGKNTLVMMYDGSVNVVQYICEGDQIMGDDSTPRTILSLAKGKETMYKVVVQDGDLEPHQYIVNESHILSLKNIATNRILDIPIKEYLDLSQEEKQVLHGYRVPIHFTGISNIDIDIDVDIDPYHVGKMAAFNGNPMVDSVKCRCPQFQLTLLAGVIDTIGIVRETNRYILKSFKKDRAFRSDLKFIARSLGYVINEIADINGSWNNTRGVYQSIYSNTSCDEIQMDVDTDSQEYDEEANEYVPRTKNETTYLEICSTDYISIDEIPCMKMIAREEGEGEKGEGALRCLTYPIYVEPIGVDDYYGFEIDGNHRFVLADFTVTHNTVMALKITSLVKKKTLIIVHKEFLMNQWIERAQEFVPSARIGKIQGPVFDVENKDIVIGMLQTLYDREFPENAFDTFGLTIIDEVHRIGSQQFSKALLRIMTPYMLGISATVDRKDGLSKVLHMFIGEKIYTESREDDDPVCVRGIEYISADPVFNLMEYDFRGNPKFSTMISKISEFGPRSDFIVRILQDLVQENPESQIMVLCHNRSLLTYFYTAINHRGFATCGYYVGGMKQHDLQETEGKQIVLATYAMAAEALDIKTLSILVMASPKTDITQSVGRILRVRHEKPIIVDIIDKHDIFQNQWRQRKTFYRKCNYRILTTDSVRYAGLGTSWTTSFEPKAVRLDNTAVCKTTDNCGEDSDEDSDTVPRSRCLISIADLDLST
jgi:Hom_end-associated Hint/Type III restriction enzyme, res subunit